MALTPVYPPEYAPAYNPIILRLDSDVTNSFTFGSSKTITDIASNGGFAQLTFSGAHLLLVGDYILVTSAPGSSTMLGVARVTSVSSGTVLTINKPFVSDVSSDGSAFKYYNNYTAVVYTYVYIDDSPITPNLISTNTVIPKKDLTGGFLYFEIDLSPILVSYNYEGLGADDVLSSDIYPLDSNPVAQINKKSFVKYHVAFAEAYDNPVAGQSEYVTQNEQT